MQLGAVFPQTEIGNDPQVIRQLAAEIEQIGYDHLLVYDHVLGAAHADRDPRLSGPFDETTPFHEVFVLLGFLAAATVNLRLATSVLVLPQRQTALVAKQAAEIAILSGNRFHLGIGTGWNYVEYEALNQGFAARGRRQEEQIDVLRLLWTNQIVDYAGEFHRIDRAAIAPRPSELIP